MRSTAQSPRARKAFSSAWAARTCPAPDVADSNSTRCSDFILRELLRMRAASGSFSLSGGVFFQNAATDFLQFAKARQVVLKIVVQKLRVLRAQLRSQNHVTQFYGMRKQRVFLQFLERNLGIVVIHGFPRQKSVSTVLYRVPLREMSFPNSGGSSPTRQLPQCARIRSARLSRRSPLCPFRRPPCAHLRRASGYSHRPPASFAVEA